MVTVLVDARVVVNTIIELLAIDVLAGLGIETLSDVVVALEFVEVMPVSYCVEVMSIVVVKSLVVNVSAAVMTALVTPMSIS